MLGKVPEGNQDVIFEHNRKGERETGE
jgi:hypothetical protein